jgi:long-subunit fatty acid transport protein
MRAIAGIGFIIGKIGIISADYEFVDYSEAKFHSSSEPFIDVNNEIHRRYAESGNLKIGTEWRYETYSFRAGYAMFGTPFASGKAVAGADQSRTAYSAGIGIRDQEYFLDLAYVYITGKYYDRPYSLSYTPVEGAATEMQTHNITLTFGVKF